MILRSIIIDDEDKGIDSIELLLKRYVPEVKIVSTTTDPEEAIELIENYKPEIIFLDINMPEMDGFELLENLKWKDFNLVFTTAHQEYALRALKNNAIDYLLKPIDHHELKSAVERIQKRMAEQNDALWKFNYNELLQDIQKKQKQRIIIHTRSGVESIDLDNIICLQAESNYTYIFLDGGEKIVTTKTLKEFENQLCEDNNKFMRVHNSYIVNLNKVVRLIKSSDTAVLKDDFKVPISKSKRDDFYAWLKI
ncbi:MAG: response regulator transcription factor [Bacteroidia bacterium]|nr:response regulator transcription factor [Bacteroidia bacterium]